LAADDDGVFHHQRRAREADCELFGINQLRVPHRLAGFHVERNETAVDGADEDLVIAKRNAAIIRRVLLH
jgi:hypothetical protein